MATIATTPAGVPATTASRPMNLFAWAVVAYNVLVILWGALVRATGSGAGCGNHWPLCNGQVIPLSPRIDTIIEFTHRMMVGGATFAVLGLLVWTFLGTHKGAAARTAAVVSTILLVNEAFLGALLVKLGYVTGNQSLGRVVVLSIHLSNTLILLAALTLTARLLTTGQSRHQLRPTKGSSPVLIVCGLAATLIVGVSGSLAALGDTLFPAASLRAAIAQDLSAASPLLIRVRWVHPASAILASIFIVWLVLRTWHGEQRLASTLIALVVLQFALGLLDIVLLAPVWLQVTHLLGADLYWITLVALASRLVWPAKTPLGLDRAPLNPGVALSQTGF